MIDFVTVGEIFTESEYVDLIEAASERGISPLELIHDVVMDDLHR